MGTESFYIWDVYLEMGYTRTNQRYDCRLKIKVWLYHQIINRINWISFEFPKRLFGIGYGLAK